MSECMTTDDIIDKEGTRSADTEEVAAAQDVVGCILDETLRSIVIGSGQACNIGDYTEDFSQQADLSLLSFESSRSRTNSSSNHSRNSSELKIDRSRTSIVSEKYSEQNIREYKVVNDKVLDSSEIRFENGQIRMDDRLSLPENPGNEPSSREEFGKKEKERYQKIFFPMDIKPLTASVTSKTSKVSLEDRRAPEPPPFAPITSETLRQSILQVWNSSNTDVIAAWDGDMSNQPEEVIRLIEEMSNLQITPPRTDDPNRPRACSLAEEDVKKMIKEIEEINFCSTGANVEEIAGQGDYEAESEPTLLYENETDEAISRAGSKVEAVCGQDPQVTSTSRSSIGEARALSSGTSLAQKKDSGNLGILSATASDVCDDAISSSVVMDHSLEISPSLRLLGVRVDSSEAVLNFEINEEVCYSDDEIDLSESVIQTIEPPPDSEDEGDSEITFSLPKKMSDDDWDIVGPNKAEYPHRSGITTVGPMKDQPYDPKDLRLHDVDFGQMTHIKGSREMMRTSMRRLATPSNMTISKDLNEDCSDRNFQINHDITSLTKLQKVREVISHQPLPTADVIDDVCMKQRLDLKDVESMLDERCAERDKSITLVSLQLANPNSVINLEDMAQATISKGNFEDGAAGRNNYGHGHSYPELPELLQDDKLTKAQSSRTLFRDKKLRNDEDAILSLMDGSQKDMEITYNPTQGENRPEHVYNINTNVQSDSVVGQKSGTLGSVFRKASNKFVRKDSDSFLRNSKSLPRDTSKLNFKLAGADSIRSLLDDCQNTAANAMKKSRSLLKNTQSLFRTISQTKFSEASLSEKQKCSHSQNDLNTAEKKPSKKDGFFRAKNAIKNRVSKTFKTSESEIPAANMKECSLVARNENDYRLEKIENVKKLTPKSPLVYRSQFVQNTQRDSNESDDVATLCDEDDLRVENSLNHIEGAQKEFLWAQNDLEEFEPAAAQKGSEKDDLPEDTLEGENGFMGGKGDLHSLSVPSGSCLGSIEHIFETVRPDPDAEAEPLPSKLEHDQEIQDDAKPDFVIQDNEDTNPNKTNLDKVSNDLRDASSRGSMKNKEKALSTNTSDIKKRKKNKKLSARIRSFWISTFGKSKTSAKKTDAS